MKKNYSMDDLICVIDSLLGENGCPWDKSQTHKSLTPYIVEESFEVVEAINNDDYDGLKEELGDVLFQILFHAKLAENSEIFSFEDIVANVKNKMIFRHPHVFKENSKINNKEEIIKNWQELKKQEKGYTDDDILKNIPKSLPSLIRAKKVIKAIEKIDNNIADMSLSICKIKDSLSNIESSLEDEISLDIDDFVQILFNLVTISSFYDLNLEIALTNALDSFINKTGHSDKYTR